MGSTPNLATLLFFIFFSYLYYAIYVYCLYLLIEFFQILKAFFTNLMSLVETKNNWIHFAKWQLKVYITSIFMLAYFYNNSKLGKSFFFISCFFAGCSGPKDPDSIFTFGFAGLVVFMFSNIMLYLLVQINYYRILLIDSIGEQYFAEYVGVNVGTRAAANAIALAKIGFFGIVGIDLVNYGTNILESHQANANFASMLNAIDVKNASDEKKLQIITEYREYMTQNAPYKSAMERIIGPGGTQTLGQILTAFNDKKS